MLLSSYKPIAGASAPGYCAYFSSLFQEPLQDFLLGLLVGQAQGHQLQNLLPCNFADGCLMDQAGIDMVTGDLRDCPYLCVAHNNGVALDMAKAGAISLDPGIEYLV